MRAAPAEKLVSLCRARALKLTTAESCTGGLVAGAITAIPGASEILDYGFITYSNAAKTKLLGVPAGLITAAGAVSEAVARRMATGALTRAGADLAVSITGIAGPGGGSPAKPVGTVWFGLAVRGPASRNRTITRHCRFAGGRDAIRAASVSFALDLLFEGITE
jgi:nicotinamide-nucleotide amidase